MVGTSSASSSLKEYLKKYTSIDDKENKKKKKRKAKPDAAGVLVVDEDPIWQKPVRLDDEEEDSADEEKPQVDEDIEVKRMKRLEQLRSKRPFGAISEDGSGWVSVSNNPNSFKSEDQNSDISPPRQRRARNDTPLPKPEHQLDIPADADLSPPRQSRKHYRSPPESVTRSPLPRGRSTRYDTPSPQTYLEASESDRVTDLSPPRRQKRDKHASSPEPGRISSHPKATDSDISPPRRLRYHDDPARKPKTGLVSGKDIKVEIDEKKKQDWLRFKEMDSSVSGRNAEPIYRNKKTGERMSKDEFLESQKKVLKKEEKPKEIKLEWGKGLAQKREAEARSQEIEAEKDKPFARGRDDPDLDAMLKERVRWGDPMAHLVKNKHLEPVLPDLGDNEKMKESGFIIPQEIPSHSWLRRGLDPAPNRYGIKPGRHWDGVDRSNGYEKEMFKRTNEKSATDREAYLWSVADM